jgi:hypothetical protein
MVSHIYMPFSSKAAQIFKASTFGNTSVHLLPKATPDQGREETDL